jgi:signal peptidase I
MQILSGQWAWGSRVGLLVLGLYIFVVREYRLNPDNLFPKVKNGDLVLALRMSFLTGHPRRGEMVLYDVQVPDKYYFSRIIGLPGETIEIGSGIVRINGHDLHEPYALREPSYSYRGRIPTDAYFVLPDDRRNLTPINQRNFGLIPARDVEGRVWLRLWPFTMRL